MPDKEDFVHEKLLFERQQTAGRVGTWNKNQEIYSK